MTTPDSISWSLWAYFSVLALIYILMVAAFIVSGDKNHFRFWITKGKK